ncbi:MAG TPA: BLUF domain-containing protein [Xanthobacteraceae bacterium]|jgi:hypothetical protein
MIIVRLTYYSRNRLDRLAGAMHDRIHDILIESVANNRRDDVTGALIHDERWFAQALEGPETMVSATFERILRDRRHADVRLIKMQPVATRRFDAWWRPASPAAPTTRTCSCTTARANASTPS